MKRKNDELSVYDREKNTKVQKVQKEIGRTSSLFAPIMLLEGHGGEIFCSRFHPDGQYIASAGYDRQIFIWSVYGECENIGVMTGHTGAIMDLKFSTEGAHIFTCSTDQTLAVWDLEKGQRIKKMKGHSTFVNSCDPVRRGQLLVASGSDDCTIKVWDPRKKNQAVSMNNTYQVTSVAFNDTAECVLTGGIDNDIKMWDLRTNSVVQKLRGHTDSVTGLSLSPDGSYILSNAMDNTVRIWDIRPYVPGERCVKVMSGHQHNFEKNLLRCAWSVSGLHVTAGSADRCVYAWDTTSRRIVYKLPGHNGSVNDVQFHPKEPIIMSCSSDKSIYLGEVESI